MIEQGIEGINIWIGEGSVFKTETFPECEVTDVVDGEVLVFTDGDGLEHSFSYDYVYTHLQKQVNYIMEHGGDVYIESVPNKQEGAELVVKIVDGYFFDSDVSYWRGRDGSEIRRSSIEKLQDVFDEHGGTIQINE